MSILILIGSRVLSWPSTPGRLWQSWRSRGFHRRQKPPLLVSVTPTTASMRPHAAMIFPKDGSKVTTTRTKASSSYVAFGGSASVENADSLNRRTPGAFKPNKMPMVFLVPPLPPPPNGQAHSPLTPYPSLQMEPGPKDPAWIQSPGVRDYIQTLSRQCFEVGGQAPYRQPDAEVNFLKKVL